MSDTITVINLEPETKQKLKQLKTFQRETWNEVILRLIEKYNGEV